MSHPFRRLSSRRPFLFIALLSLLMTVAGLGGLTYDLAAAPSADAATTVTRASIVSIAQGEVGNSEANGRCAKYGPCTTTPWCAMFVEWVWDAANVSKVPSTWVGRGVGQWGQDNGLWKARPSGSRGNPLPGDLVVYGSPDYVTGGHVGLVASVNSDGTITTIDGNWGDSVVKRTINPLTATGGASGLPISGYVEPANVADATPRPPAPVNRVGASAIEFNKLFYAFSRGVSNELRMNYFVPGTGWEKNHNVEGSVTTQPVAVEHLDSMWVTTRGADGTVQYRILTDSGWDPWRTIPGAVVGAPAMVEMNGTLYIYARLADGTMHYRYHTSAGWNADGTWKTLGGSVASDPTVTVFNGAMYVFARGTNGHDTFRYWTSANGWSAWIDLAGTAAGRPTVAVAGKTLHVLTRDNTNQIRRHSLTVGAAAWQTNIAMGGPTTADPSAVAAGSQLHVFVEAPDETVKYLYLDGSTWSDWRDLDGHTSTTLFTGLRGGNRFVFTNTANNQLELRYWAPDNGGDTSSSPAGWNAWTPLVTNVHP